MRAYENTCINHELAGILLAHSNETTTLISLRPSESADLPLAFVDSKRDISFLHSALHEGRREGK